MKFFSKHNNQGFTLIELLVVILILGLLIGVVGPRVIGRTDDAKVSAARIQIEGLVSACICTNWTMGPTPAPIKVYKPLSSRRNRAMFPENGARGGIWKEARFRKTRGAMIISICHLVRMATSICSLMAPMACLAETGTTKISPTGSLTNSRRRVSRRIRYDGRSTSYETICKK
jgi:prepilin-type N-terminal cleavage/methylation domain-containing protein